MDCKPYDCKFITNTLKLCLVKNDDWGNIDSPKRTLHDTIRQRLTCFKIQAIAKEFNEQIKAKRQALAHAYVLAHAQAQQTLLQRQNSVSQAPQSRKAIHWNPNWQWRQK